MKKIKRGIIWLLWKIGKTLIYCFVIPIGFVGAVCGAISYSFMEGYYLVKDSLDEIK